MSFKRARSSTSEIISSRDYSSTALPANILQCIRSTQLEGSLIFEEKDEFILGGTKAKNYNVNNYALKISNNSLKGDQDLLLNVSNTPTESQRIKRKIIMKKNASVFPSDFFNSISSKETKIQKNRSYQLDSFQGSDKQSLSTSTDDTNERSDGHLNECNIGDSSFKTDESKQEININTPRFNIFEDTHLIDQTITTPFQIHSPISIVQNNQNLIKQPSNKIQLGKGLPPRPQKNQDTNSHQIIEQKCTFGIFPESNNLRTATFQQIQNVQGKEISEIPQLCSGSYKKLIPTNSKKQDCRTPLIEDLSTSVQEKNNKNISISNERKNNQCLISKMKEFQIKFEKVSKQKEHKENQQIMNKIKITSQNNQQRGRSYTHQISQHSKENERSKEQQQQQSCLRNVPNKQKQYQDKKNEDKQLNSSIPLPTLNMLNQNTNSNNSKSRSISSIANDKNIRVSSFNALANVNKSNDKCVLKVIKKQ